MPGLPSWVPDFSSKTAPLIDVGVIAWYVMYHTNSVQRDNRPILQLQHSRHILHRDPIEAAVEDRRLITWGFIVDEIQDLLSSTFFSSRDVIRRHIRSCAEDSNTSPGGLRQDSWRFLRSLDDRFDDIKESNDLSKIYEDEEPTLYTVLTLNLANILRYVTLIQIDKVCRKKVTELGINVNANE